MLFAAAAAAAVVVLRFALGLGCRRLLLLVLLLLTLLARRGRRGRLERRHGPLAVVLIVVVALTALDGVLVLGLSGIGIAICRVTFVIVVVILVVIFVVVLLRLGLGRARLLDFLERRDSSTLLLNLSADLRRACLDHTLTRLCLFAGRRCGLIRLVVADLLAGACEQTLALVAATGLCRRDTLGLFR